MLFKFEPFLYYNDSTNENEDMNINDISMVLISVIFILQTLNVMQTNFKSLQDYFDFIHIQNHMGGL